MAERMAHGFGKGQAMIETVVAMVFLTFVFLGLFWLSRLLSARIMLDHAAARAARARSVGFNDFMCRKTARAAIIPVAGRRVWPEPDIGDFEEAARIPVYLASESESEARGILEYEYWNTSHLSIDDGALDISPVAVRVRMETDDFSMEGKARIEAHFPHYMTNGGR